MLSDSRTRKAIALYLDKTNLIANLGNGYMQTNFLLPQNNWIYDTKLDTVYISDQADSLLMEAGWNYLNNKWINNGKVLTFTIIVDGNKKDRVIAANVISAQLANHGIEVKVKEEDSGSFANDFNNRNYEAMVVRNANWL